MVLGFFRHMYQYFKPDDGDPGPPKNAVLPANMGNKILMYDPEGKFIGYAKYHQETPPSNAIQSKIKKTPEEKAPEEILYRKMPDGQFIAVSPNPAPLHDKARSVDQAPKLAPVVTPTSVVPSVTSSVISTVSVPTRLQDVMPPEGWNGWPDGEFQCFVTKEEFKATGDLKIHWAYKSNGGDKTGKKDSPIWKHGKRTTRDCLGALICDNIDCKIVLRPHVRPEAIAKQVVQGCTTCGSSVTRIFCPNRAKFWVYAHGVHYDNGLPHSHPRHSHILGLLPHERERFEAIVTAHPKAGPVQLITGIPTINGPGESVADISDCLINVDRVNKEKQKIVRQSGMGGDSFLTAYTKFCRNNPGFVIFSQFAEVTVICLQSPFMASQLVKDGIMDGPVNGLVSDATHSFFADNDAKLIISSVYSPELCCWVPGIFSYANGETIEHYELHFAALFESIAHEASLRGIEVVDETFIGVLDFSEAERSGFISAFITFWTQRSDTRTSDDLKEVAQGLLRGCQQHFRASITRLKKIHGVVGVGQETAFEARALSLLDAADHEDFPSSLRSNTLLPDTDETVSSHGLVYDLVGLALFRESDSHFIAQHFSKDHKKIFTYDSMLFQGRPSIEDGAFSSQHSLPKGFRVSAVFYHLRGGWNAQQHFYALRRSQCDTLYNLSISGATLDTLPSGTYNDSALKKMEPSDRYWMANPYKSHSIEYILKPPATRRAWVDVSDGSGSTAAPESEEEMNIPIAIEKPSEMRSSSPALSLPDSLFDINCRCGITGDGNILYDAQRFGEAIQCDNCKCWSHIACQREGRASNLSKNAAFECDGCNVLLHFPKKQPARTSKSAFQREMAVRTKMKKPLKDRLWAGRGALARHGDYWYPVRLIMESEGGWIVQWWKGNIFLDNTISPDQTSFVSKENLVDSLWNKAVERRKIRLGKWTHPGDIRTSEDILANPASIPYSKSIDEILSPETRVLKSLLACDKDLDQTIPAKTWLESTNSSPTTTLVPFVGALSIVERAEIANWFECHVANNDKSLRISWLGLLPIAHAYTLVLSAHLKAADEKYQNMSKDELLEKAWDAQFVEALSVLTDVDVEKECLEILEREMFEVSKRAGIAGNAQWGLDAGDHQYWSPYRGLPFEWNLGDYEGDEDELNRGPNYVQNPSPPASEMDIPAKTRPRPRPTTRKKK